MAKFAEGTSVPVERSKQEIERTLNKYGATEFVYGTRQDKAMVGFVLQSRHIRFTLPLPDPKDPKFRHTATGRWRTPGKHQDLLANKDFQQECRRLWRALHLAIKAKLEMVESGIATIDEEFLGYMVMPTGETVGEWASPQLQNFIDKGNLPKLLPGG